MKEKELREELTKEAEKANDDPDKIETYLQIKAELDRHEENRYMGAIKISRVDMQWKEKNALNSFSGWRRTNGRKCTLEK